MTAVGKFKTDIFKPRSIAFNTITQLSGKVLTGTGAIVLAGFLARKLGADGFGQCSLLFAWFATLMVFSDMGLYLTGIRFLSIQKSDDLPILENLFTLRLTFTTLCISAAMIILFYFPYPGSFKKNILLSFAAVFFLSIARTFKSWFQANHVMHISVIAEVFGFYAGILIIIAAFHYTAVFDQIILSISSGVVAGSLLYFVVSCFCFYMRRKCFFSFRFNNFVLLAKESFPLGLSAILAVLLLRVDMLMLSWMKSFGDVGIYGAAYTIIEVTSILPGLFLGSMLPLFARSIVGSSLKLEAYYHHSFDVLSFFAVPVLVGGLILAEPIMIFFSGTNFIAGSGYTAGQTLGGVFRILVTVSCLIFWGQLNGHVLLAGAHQKIILMIYCLILPLNIILNFIFIPLFSYNGAAVATLISELIALMTGTFIVYRKYNQWPNFRMAVKACGASVLMGAFIYILNQIDGIHVLVIIISGSVIYFLAMTLIYKVNSADLFAF